MRSKWAHSTSSLWYSSVCIKLQQQITAEYNRGPERCRGLASRWWKGSLEKILAPILWIRKNGCILFSSSGDEEIGKTRRSRSNGISSEHGLRAHYRVSFCEEVSRETEVVYFADIYLLGRYGGRDFLNILISIHIGKC